MDFNVIDTVSDIADLAGSDQLHADATPENVEATTHYKAAVEAARTLAGALDGDEHVVSLSYVEDAKTITVVVSLPA